jgi:hypothetical protein
MRSIQTQNSQVDGATLPNFNHLARIYRWMEWLSFGPWLSRCRKSFLGRLTDRRRALILGDGDGRFTASLLRENPHIEIDALDASGAMLRALLRRAEPHRERIRTVLADVRQWRPPSDRSYDLVATHFFLDCLTTEEVLRLADAVRPALAVNALWVVSEFAIPKSGFGRLVAKPLVTALYGAFGMLTGLEVRRLPDFHVALRAAGFSPIERRNFLHGLLVSETWMNIDEGANSDEATRLAKCAARVIAVAERRVGT